MSVNSFKIKSSLFKTLTIVFLLSLTMTSKTYARPSLEVSINESTQPTVNAPVDITGTSGFDSSNVLVVYIDTITNFHVFNTQGNWTVENQTFGGGTHRIRAVLFRTNCVLNDDYSVSSPSCMTEADTTWTFTLLAPPTEPTHTFKKDTRCLDSKPPLITWSSYNSQTEQLTWSAVGGNKVELNFGYSKTFLPFKLTLKNDGHEKTGLGSILGWFGGYWKMRTINGCKTGNWSDVYTK